MTEDEYIAATDLEKMRAADRILRDVLRGDAPMREIVGRLGLLIDQAEKDLPELSD